MICGPQDRRGAREREVQGRERSRSRDASKRGLAGGAPGGRAFPLPAAGLFGGLFGKKRSGTLLRTGGDPCPPEQGSVELRLRKSCVSARKLVARTAAPRARSFDARATRQAGPEVSRACWRTPGRRLASEWAPGRLGSTANCTGGSRWLAGFSCGAPDCSGIPGGLFSEPP